MEIEKHIKVMFVFFYMYHCSLRQFVHMLVDSLCLFVIIERFCLIKCSDSEVEVKHNNISVFLLLGTRGEVS